MSYQAKRGTHGSSFTFTENPEKAGKIIELCINQDYRG